jgi:hypothetical protein
MRRAACSAVQCLAALAPGAQAAQWTKLPAVAGGTAFIDRASIVKMAPNWKAWTMEVPAGAHQTPDGHDYRAVKSLHAYSCDDHTATLLMQVFYTDASGKGDAVQTVKYEKFTADEIVPDSATDSALQVVCKVAAARTPPPAPAPGPRKSS